MNRLPRGGGRVQWGAPAWLLLLACLWPSGMLLAQPAATLLATDLMRGSPPPAERRVNRGNFMQFPYLRWSLQHIRELHPTREVYRGVGAAAELPVAAADLGNMMFEVSEGRTVSLDTWLAESVTDSFLVLHRGRLVYERYFNGMTAQTQHQMFSATKSFVGTLMLMLIEEGKVDPVQKVGHYVPELQGSAFGDATVQQVLDMTTSIAFSEDYEDPTSDVTRYGYIFGISDSRGGYEGARSVYAYLPTLVHDQRKHGDAFHYVTPNTDVLGWIASRVTGMAVSELLETRIWQHLGVQRDGYFWLDPAGAEMAGGGLNITARDAARFGQMILQQGRYNNRQVLPPAVAERILQPGNPAPFSKLYQDPWYENVGYAYHDQWWTFNNPHKAVSAIGVHGQFIYLDPVAEMVIVKHSSHPDAEGTANEVDGPMIWHALARHLSKKDPAVAASAGEGE